MCAGAALLLASHGAGQAGAAPAAEAGGTAAGLPAEGTLEPFRGEPRFEMQQVFSGDRFPNVVVATDGTVLAFWNGVKVRRSEDGGKTWGEEILVGKGFMGGGVTVDENSGEILAFVETELTPQASLTVYRSTDHGKTWKAQETVIHPDKNGNVPKMHMNEHGITLRHGKHKGRLLRPTRWNAGKNDPSFYPRHYTDAIYSDDGGKTWKTSDPFPAMGTGEGAVAELSNGHIYYSSRNHWFEKEADFTHKRPFAWSYDGGQTWADAAYDDELPDGPRYRGPRRGSNYNGHFGMMCGLARLPVEKQDILIYSNADTPGHERVRMTVWASFDGGKSWPIKRLVFEGSSAYSSLDAGRPGTPSEGWIYLQFEGGPKGGSTVARFNLAWLLEGEKIGDGETPKWMSKTPSLAVAAEGHPSPPMGWNSYTGYSIAVTEKELLKNIDFLSEKLLPYGYDTVTVDNGWFLSGQGEGITMALDAYGRPESHEHFFPRGLKYTIDYAHKKGVKFGIWLLRGINRRAVEENLPVEGTKYRMQDIVNRKSVCPWAVAPWWNYGVDMTKPGAQEYYDGLIRKYADMGVGFIKFDDIVPNPDEVEAVVKAIDKCGRKIVLSLSPGDDIKVEHSDAYKKANMVRITSDIWDNKGSLETAFKRWEAMQDYTGPESGSFLDMDMVCFGRLSVTQNGGRDCKFTEDQKRTFMVQRALAASPLMLGGVLYTMDDFSLSLFTHPDILACNKNAVIGKLVHRDGNVDVWKTPERGNEKNGWIGIFNRNGDKSLTVEKGLTEMGLDAGRKYVLKDLWSGKSLPVSGKHVFEIPADGVVFLRYEHAEKHTERQ